MKKVCVLSAVLVCLLAGGNTVSASPILVSATGLSVAIPDDGYNGTLGSMTSYALAVTGAESSLTDIDVILGLDHTWVGDLVIKLVDPYGTLVTLVSRAGAAELADGGVDNPAGDSSNLLGTFPITFDDSALVSAELMGSTLGGDGVICRDSLSPCAYAPNSGAAAPGNLASFNGRDPNGTWTIYIGDAAALDVGTLRSFSLSIDSVQPTAVPEPATLMMVGTGLLAFKARRRAAQRRR